MLNTASGEVITPRFMRRREVERVTGLPRATIYEMIADGRFPKQVRLSPRLVGWIEAEVHSWMQARISERDRKAA